MINKKFHHDHLDKPGEKSVWLTQSANGRAVNAKGDSLPNEGTSRDRFKLTLVDVSSAICPPA